MSTLYFSIYSLKYVRKIHQVNHILSFFYYSFSLTLMKGLFAKIKGLILCSSTALNITI